MRSKLPTLVALAAMALLVPAATFAASPDAASPAPSAPVASPEPFTHAPLEGTRWHLRQYRAEDGGLAGPTYDAWVTLEDGILTGNTGCNDLAGSYTLEGDSVVLADLSPTEATCLDGDIVAQEMALVGRLPDADQVQFDGPDLWLLEQGRQSLRFDALEGPVWTPLYGGAEPMPEGNVTVEFRDGGVVGQGPCNTFAGPFIHDGASLVIGPLESTRMACPDLELENELLTDLQLARSYAFEAGDLVLLDEAGSSIRSFAQASTGD